MDKKTIQKHIIELEKQLDFMQEKLEKSRQLMDKTELVYVTENKNGKKVPKRNPFYDEYNGLMKTYNATIDHLIELEGEGGKAEQRQKGSLVKFENKFKIAK